MNKNTCVVYAPVQTYSGYGARARDFIRALFEAKEDEWDIKILPCRWGNTSMTFIEDNKEEWGWLEDHFIQNLQSQPDYMFWVTVPNEAQKIGKWNCVVTAGIETTICAPQWIEGCNRMDLVITSSEHSKKTFEDSKFQIQDQRTGQQGVLQCTTPIKVLLEGAGLEVYKKITLNEFTNSELKETLDSIPEKYAFLFVGHWMQGDLGEDRKNVGLLVKAFYEMFKNKKNKPALILKSSIVNSSIIDKRELLKRLDTIKNSVEGDDLPNIYLLHGEFDDNEMNEIYNHPKIKTMVSLTKGEGFGRPLLEFSLTGKPVVATDWSGHIDFLKHSTLLPGKLTNVHPSAAVKDMILQESQWFSVDMTQISPIFNALVENYKDYKKKASKQLAYSKSNFSFDKMKEKLNKILEEDAPKIARQVELKLPKLQPKKLELPKLQ